MVNYNLNPQTKIQSHIVDYDQLCYSLFNLIKDIFLKGVWEQETKHTCVSLRGSRRDQEDGGGAGPLSYRVQARSRGWRWCWPLKLQGPGEIKRMEVVLAP